MINKTLLAILFISVVLNSCKENNNTIKDIDNKAWQESTISFFKKNCKISSNPAIKNDSLIGPDGKSFPEKINNKLVYTVPEKIIEIIRHRKDLVKTLLDENNKINLLDDNKLYISEFYRYNQSHPYYIIYSDINAPWILKFDIKLKKYLLKKKEDDIKNTGMDHSSIVNDKCIIRLYGVIRDLEIFTEMTFSEEGDKYETKFISLGS